MPFQPFVMERVLSKHEKEVEYNLSESGVHPLTLSGLLDKDPGALRQLLSTEVDYAHANGIPELRGNIARMYDGATPENVLVTIGAAEANFNTIQTLLEPGDEVAIMLPNYMQAWGIASNRGCVVNIFHLREDLDWAPDLAELDSVITRDTKLIAVCNPNNPTGRILTDSEMNRIVAAAAKVGAWILADEVYRGANRVSDEENPSFYGRYDRVIAVSSMSKAYGLPGLRVGWAVGPVATIDQIWARHEYTTISAALLSSKLAALALSPAVRPQLLQRARDFIRKGYTILDPWLRSHGETFRVRPPDAAAIAFVRYDIAMNSTEFTERLRKEKSVLIVPGDHFGVDGYVRISFGLPEDYLVSALNRIHDLIIRIRGES